MIKFPKQYNIRSFSLILSEARNTKHVESASNKLYRCWRLGISFAMVTSSNFHLFIKISICISNECVYIDNLLLYVLIKFMNCVG